MEVDIKLYRNKTVHRAAIETFWKAIFRASIPPCRRKTIKAGTVISAPAFHIQVKGRECLTQFNSRLGVVTSKTSSLAAFG